jgi:phosphate transport system substrate-binding protein
MHNNNVMKMKTKISILSLVAAIAVAVVPAQAGSITVKGSDTMVILAQKWAEVYMGSHADTKIQVTGGGSGVGLAALQNGQIDIANSSRPIKAQETEAYVKKFGKRAREYKVALDGLSVYVNNDNPIKELDLTQLQAIFTGKIKNWKEVGGNDSEIIVYSRENSSGSYEFFKEHVLKGKDFVASAQTMPGTAALLQAIEKDKRGIGYGGAAYGAGARAIGVKKDASSPAVQPSEETVVNGTYPIWRYLFVYLNPEADKDEIGTYLNWIRSDAGQKIVKEIGYYPLPDKLREK